MTIEIKRSPSETLIRNIITKIAVGPNRGKDITKVEAYQATKFLLDNKLNETQAALFLIGLRLKGETKLEYAGVYKALQESTHQIKVNLPEVVYLADPYDGYSRSQPVSPYIPAVLASCGVPCIIQGLEAVGPKFGITAHQVYAANELPTNLSVEEASKKLLDKDCGWTYIDQSQSNPKLHNLKVFRDTIVKRTALTTIERLLMPIKAKSNYLALGYVHKAYPEIYGLLSSYAGFNKSLLIKGREGGICPALDKPMRTYEVVNKVLSKKQIEATPIELMHLIIKKKEGEPAGLAHLSDVIEKPNSIQCQELISASSLILARNKDIPINRAVALVKSSIESGEAVKHFSAFK